MRIIVRWFGFCLAYILVPLIALADAPKPPAAKPLPKLSTSAANNAADVQGTEFFENNIRPLFISNCISCHGAAKQEAGLRLDSDAAFLKGTDSGPIVTGTDVAKSLLMEVVGYSGDTKMPPGGKLPSTDIAKLEKWIGMGAPWPANATLSGSGASAIQPFDLAKRKASHWAWKPIRKVEPAKTIDSAWPKTPIDRFVLAKLEQAGLRPAPPADRSALCRRAFFDIIGLPPTLQELAAFLNDKSPTAYESLIDRLLASPHFGEKWARHWMDLVHYAESRGHEFDYAIPNAWQYRDYLIRAFNADVPYDQFVTEHLAGDLLEHPRLNPSDGSNESVLGTGFWFLGEEVHSPVDIRQDETDRMATRLDTMTKTFLGLTVGCARCHDHKFDAISQKDYYALSGFLISSTYRQVRFESMEANRKIAEKLAALDERAGKELLIKTVASERLAVNRVADYLMATREAVLSGVKTAVRSGSPQDQVATIAAKHRLDCNRLAAWLDAVLSAQHKPLDPLYAFATVAAEKKADEPQQFMAQLKPVLAASAVAEPPLQVVVDYDRADRETWYTDGFTFGLGPKKAGGVIWGGSTAVPVIEVLTRGAAWRDPAWNGLVQAGGSENESGSLGGWARSGRIVRTPKVTLQDGKLFYLVRGAGRAYASVDSHLMVAGPLHGRVLHEWDASGHEWTWVGHDLTPYKGHRVEVEFSPKTNNGTFAVAMVVEAKSKPPLPQERNAVLQADFARPNVISPASLAQAYQQICDKGLAMMAEGKWSSGKPATANETSRNETAAWTQLGNWIVQNPSLFTDAQSAAQTAARQDVAKAAQAYAEERAALVKQIQVISHSAPAMMDGNGVDENLLKRGSPKLAEAPVPRRFLEALGGAAATGYGPGSGRLILAHQILQPGNPFPARVLVNRVWYHLFGTGIVPAVDNFGVLGQAPSHPELLDYLAEEFRGSSSSGGDGWSVKKLIRSIMLSSTYRMSSGVDASAEARDPQNLLLHRMPVKRLTAEAIRDSILAVSQSLDPSAFGRPVEVHVTPYMGGRGEPSSGPLDGGGRRSIYIKIRRNFLSPMMLAYDMPIPFATQGRRNVSNVPAQALILMNDPFVVEQAKNWARHTLENPKEAAEARIENMYLAAFARQPTGEEKAQAIAFLDAIGEAYGLPPQQRKTSERTWADLAHVLFNTKEFIFIR